MMNPEEIILLNNIVDGAEINPFWGISVAIIFFVSLILCQRDS